MKRLLTILLVITLLLSVPALATEDETDGEEEALFAAGTAAIEACLDESMSDVEKLTAIHDWLALHCDYGATRRGSTAYGALVEGTANCVGYAEGFAYLATLAGLDGVSTYSEDMDHAWILVTLDGVRYFSDCTWDDGKNAKIGLIRHRYWLFDDANAGDTGHYYWDSDETVPGGELELAPWGASVTRVIFDGDYAYFIDEDFCLWRCDRSTWELELLLQTDERWPDTAPDDGKDPELYSGLLFFGGRLFFNTPAGIWSIDPAGGEPLLVKEPPIEEGECVYGIAVRDGQLCYSVADEPGAAVYDVIGFLPVRSAWGEG